MMGPLQVLVIAFPELRFDGSRQASRVAAAQPNHAPPRRRRRPRVTVRPGTTSWPSSTSWRS